MDRLVVKPDLKGRVTDSVETALTAAEGLVVDRRGRQARPVVLAAPRVRRLRDLDRRSRAADVLVQLPVRRLPRLRRPGRPQVVRPRQAPHGSHEDAARGRAGMGRRELVPGPRVGRVPRLQGLARHAVREAARRRSRRSCGTGPASREFTFKWEGRRSSYEWKRSWDGILPSLERKYRETASENRREELEKFMSVHRCPVCQGARLKPETLAVKLEGKTIAEHTALSVARAAPLVPGAEARREGARRSPRRS